MARVTVELPSLLRPLAGGARTIAIEAQTLAESLAELVRKLPALEVHLFDERGEMREHVLCFHNEVNTRWLDSLDRPLVGGDRITIMQCVSGG